MKSSTSFFYRLSRVWVFLSVILFYTERERKIFPSFVSVPHSLVSSSQRNGKVTHGTNTKFEKITRDQNKRKSIPKDGDAVSKFLAIA